MIYGPDIDTGIRQELKNELENCMVKVIEVKVIEQKVFKTGPNMLKIE